MRSLWLPGLALILALGFWLRPYALGLYHLEAGGRWRRSPTQQVAPIGRGESAVSVSGL